MMHQLADVEQERHGYDTNLDTSKVVGLSIEVTADVEEFLRRTRSVMYGYTKWKCLSDLNEQEREALRPFRYSTGQGRFHA